MHFPGPTACGSSAMRPLLRYGPEKQRWLTNILEQVYRPLAEPESEPQTISTNLFRSTGTTHQLSELNQSDGKHTHTHTHQAAPPLSAAPKTPTPGAARLRRIIRRGDEYVAASGWFLKRATGVSWKRGSACSSLLI